MRYIYIYLYVYNYIVGVSYDKGMIVSIYVSILKVSNVWMIFLSTPILLGFGHTFAGVHMSFLD